MEMFQCEPMRTESGAPRLRREGCGDRYKHAMAGNLNGVPCRGCVVGEAHSIGERPTKWPDGTLIVVSGLATPIPPPRPGKRASNGKIAATITHWGVTKTYAEWVKDDRVKQLGLNPKMIYMRKRNGWSDRDTLTIAKGGKPIDPSTTPDKAPPKREAPTPAAKPKKPTRRHVGPTTAEVAEPPLLTPEAVLRVLGYEVLFAGRSPAGMIILVKED